MTGIKKTEHGFLDYSYAPLVWMAPKIAGFEYNKKATVICRAFGATDLVYSLLTDAKWGVIKLIPYKTHAALDFASGVAALVASQLEGKKNNKSARNTFKLMGLVGITVGILSLIGAKHSK